MPISSFYGMQTSLRGLDRAATDARHHRPQHRERVDGRLLASGSAPVRVAAPSRSRSRAAANMTGAHLGSGVDVQGFRRVRDTFLDAQYRAQNTNLSDWKSRAEGLDSAELSLNEPSDTGINAQLSKFWQSWSDLSKSPDDQAAKQALVQQAGALTDSIHSVRSQMVAAQDAATGQYNQIAGNGGEVSKIASELAGLNKSISVVPHQRRQPERPDGPPRPADRSALAVRPGLRRSAPGRLDQRLLRRRHDRDQVPDRDRPDRRLGRPAGRWLVAGRPDGRPARHRQGRRHDRRLPDLDRQLRRLARQRGQQRLRRRLLHLQRALGRHPRRLVRDPDRAGQHHLGLRRDRLQRPRAGRLAAARQRRPSTASTRRSSPRSAAISTSRSGCRPTRRCWPTPSRTAARAWPASRWTRRCPTSCASSVPTRPPRAPCRPWTRCWTSSSTVPEGSGL